MDVAERMNGDVAILAQAFLDDLSARHGKAAHGFSPEALEFLENWDWPGNNVRLWRVDTEEAGEGVRDGRWRWIGTRTP